jgi:hypothetical protein
MTVVSLEQGGAISVTVNQIKPDVWYVISFDASGVPTISGDATIEGSVIQTRADSLAAFLSDTPTPTDMSIDPSWIITVTNLGRNVSTAHITWTATNTPTSTAYVDTVSPGTSITVTALSTTNSVTTALNLTPPWTAVYRVPADTTTVFVVLAAFSPAMSPTSVAATLFGENSIITVSTATGAIDSVHASVATVPETTSGLLVNNYSQLTRASTSVESNSPTVTGIYSGADIRQLVGVTPDA